VGDILVCPKCQERLWVGEMQIPLVTCPKCLGVVINPNAAREPIASEAGQILPRQVIPVESEAQEDIWGTTVLLRPFAAALVGAGILLIKMTGLGALSLILIVSGIVTLGLIWVLRGRTRTEVPAPVYLQRAQRGPEILEYANMPQERNIGAFVAGFILALAYCFAAMIGILTTNKPMNRELAIAAAVVGVAVLLFCGFRASKRQQKGGFYGGVMSGLVLGAMSCGPCSLIVFE
jgi:hypothetical protein